MEWEFDMLNWIQTWHTPMLDEIMLFLSFLGDKGGFWILLTMTFLLRKSTRTVGLVMMAALVIDVIMCNGILKPLIARPRPCSFVDIALLVPRPSDLSFPSGHTAASFAAAMALYFMQSRLAKPALLLAALIAFSRLYLYVHFPTDIVGGVMVGILAAFLAKKIVGKWKKWPDMRSLKNMQKTYNPAQSYK